MEELETQLQTHLFIFRVSKELIEKEYGKFKFPKNCTQNDAIKQVEIFRKICSYKSEKD